MNRDQPQAHALERIDHDEVASGSLLALTHLQRYRLAARFAGGARVVDLCCGVGYGSALLAAEAASVTGVDLDAAAIGAAEARSADVAVFVVADALEYLERLDPRNVDVIVCFEGIEHVPDPGLLADALARHARAGVRIIASLPNSAGFGEVNPFHTVAFGYEEATALFDRVGEHILLTQRPAEGTVIGPADDRSASVEGSAAIHRHDTDPAWAGHWLAVWNVDAADLLRERLELCAVAVPSQHQYMRALERSNAELYRANLRLSREHLSKHDAAAGITIGRLERAVADARAEHAESQRNLAAAVESARVNDELFQEARGLFYAHDALLKTPRHRFVERAARMAPRVPLLGAARRALARFTRR
ncbi:MAG: Methyltransferase type 12 [Frankiales bacterium]|nr:Methyltransferase type 12 [Frankiales bacterium]